MMGFLTVLFRLLSLTPIVVAGVESLHSEASGATKKQLAMDALNIDNVVSIFNAAGTFGHGAALPGSQPAVTAMTGAVGGVIDNVVSIFNAAGTFGHKATAAAGPVVVTTS